ncbi:MAG: translation elongation factor Ts [Planctomycetes bacterium]|nr:translation elongation factor Ts [Planctomycetota bacterium]
MAEITVALIKELRERTGCGMMDAKRALQESGGDVQKAIDDLRKKGEVKADNKAGRATTEGRVGIEIGGKAAAVVAVQSETDFTANNDEFQVLVGSIAKAIHASEGEPSELKVASGGTVGEAIKALVAKTGENMQIGKHARLTVDNGYFGHYLHSDSKLGVIVKIEGGDGGSDAEKALAKDIAMHAAATNPLGLTKEDVPADVIAKEREIALDQARQSGKPENIQEKIAEGKVNAFFKEQTLLAQPFVKDTSVTVEQHVANVAKESGKPLKLTGYARIKVGG